MWEKTLIDSVCLSFAQSVTATIRKNTAQYKKPIPVEAQTI